MVPGSARPGDPLLPGGTGTLLRVRRARHPARSAVTRRRHRADSPQSRKAAATGCGEGQERSPARNSHRGPGPRSSGIHRSPGRTAPRAAGTGLSASRASPRPPRASRRSAMSPVAIPTSHPRACHSASLSFARARVGTCEDGLPLQLRIEQFEDVGLPRARRRVHHDIPSLPQRANRFLLPEVGDGKGLKERVHSVKETFGARGRGCKFPLLLPGNDPRRILAPERGPEIGSQRGLHVTDGKKPAIRREAQITRGCNGGDRALRYLHISPLCRLSLAGKAYGGQPRTNHTGAIAKVWCRPVLPSTQNPTMKGL